MLVGDMCADLSECNELVLTTCNILLLSVYPPLGSLVLALVCCRHGVHSHP